MGSFYSVQLQSATLVTKGFMAYLVGHAGLHHIHFFWVFRNSIAGLRYFENSFAKSSSKAVSKIISKKIVCCLFLSVIKHFLWFSWLQMIISKFIWFEFIWPELFKFRPEAWFKIGLTMEQNLSLVEKSFTLGQYFFPCLILTRVTHWFFWHSIINP